MVRGKSIITLLAALPSIALVYPDGPPVGHTGGFGEPTCHSCHFDSPLNSSDARVGIDGVPFVYVPDSTYRVAIGVSRSDLGAGGFSMAARFLDGRQAGTLEPTDDRATIVVDSGGVQFAMHTLEGTEPVVLDSISWLVDWRAPSGTDSVVFHLATNAANGDDSEFGDLIQTAVIRTHALDR